MRPRSITRSVVALSALAMALTLVSCGNDTGGQDDTAKDTSADSADSAAGGFPREVKHTMGTTTIPERPKRVVALDPSFIDNTLLLQTDVVGYASYRAVQSTLPDYLGPARTKYADGAKRVGTIEAPKLEQVALLKPDLILSAKVRHGPLYEKLSKIAPTVMPETTGPTWKENITLAAEALGQEDLAAKEIAAYEKRAKAIGDEINAKAKNPEISVVRFVDGPTRLYAKASFSGVVLADAGLARPKVQDVEEFSVDISEERIPDADADHIFVTTYTEGGPSAANTKAKFERNPLWGKLQGTVHEVDDELWMTPCSLQGAHQILDDLASTFEVDPHK